MKNMMIVILATFVGISASAIDRENPTDGITSKSMLRALFSNSGTLQAQESEHGKVVNQIPVELVLANSISGGAQLSNECSFIQKSKIIECVLEIKTTQSIENLVYKGLYDSEAGAKIISVDYYSY